MKLWYHKYNGRSNDYRFVTEYNVYWYGVGSAHQLSKGVRHGDMETNKRLTRIFRKQ